MKAPAPKQVQCFESTGRRRPTEPRTLQTFGESLRRCGAEATFLDRFYDRFLASSPKVREKFASTDFVRQKRAVLASLDLIHRVAQAPEEADRHLRDVAERHSSSQLDVGAELYDLWLDSLLATVREVDPAFGPEVEQAWEDVMAVGIRYLTSRY
jgi:hemoglobin-like flavoprotein